MPKRKFTHHDIDMSITRILVKTPERNHQEMLELIIAQYIDVLSKSNKKVQDEHMVGLNSFLKEVENGVY